MLPYKGGGGGGGWHSYLPNGKFEKTGQGFSVKTGQNTGQNFRALPWMPSEDQKKRKKKQGHHFIRSILYSVSLHILYSIGTF